MRKFIFIFFAFFISTAASLAAECTAETTQDKCTCAGWGWEPTTEKCVQCSGNTYAADGDSVCTECPIGFTAVDDHTNCYITCDAGTYYDSEKLSCQKCANLTSHEKSFSHNYIDNNNVDECTPCDNIPTGAIQDSTHATCNWTMTCPAGTYYDANTQECKQCEGDTFSTGTTVYQDSQTTKCTPCASNSHANNDHKQCLCDNGFFSDGNGGCSNTKSCSAGTYLSADGSCKTCEQGYYCPGGSQQNDGSGQTPCLKHFTSDSGATSKSGCYMKTDTRFCDDSDDCYQYSDIFGTGKINYPG